MGLLQLVGGSGNGFHLLNKWSGFRFLTLVNENAKLRMGQPIKLRPVPRRRLPQLSVGDNLGQHQNGIITISVSMESNYNGVVQGAETVDKSCTEIIIVRHGETEWNALKKIQGQADIELNETGKQQAKTVAERLSREAGIVAIYSSDLKRAFETAEIISARCHGLEVIADEDLRERHVGEFQGVVYSDARKLNPEVYDALVSQELDQEIPGGGETLRELRRRCTSSLQRISEKHRGQRVVVVTHQHVIETLYKRAQPEGKYEGIKNSSIGIIQLSEGDIWLIKSWNDDSHLSDNSSHKRLKTNGSPAPHKKMRSQI